MRLTNIIAAMRFEPWAITPAAYAAAAELVARVSTGQMRADDDMLEKLVNTRQPMSVDAKGNATIHIFGTLLSKSTPIERTCGNTDYAQIRSEISDAKAQGATRITFICDSPGGMERGVISTADAIRNCGVETIAYVDGQCCSACYWLASQCDTIAATKDSSIGSIGVIMPWIDKVGMWEQLGIAWNPITNDGATLKGAGAGPELTDEQRSFLTDAANKVAANFYDAINAKRSPSPEVLNAGWWGASESKDLNLIDEIV